MIWAWPGLIWFRTKIGGALFEKSNEPLFIIKWGELLDLLQN
jgi:hypothetical protein